MHQTIVFKIKKSNFVFMRGELNTQNKDYMTINEENFISLSSPFIVKYALNLLFLAEC